MSQGTIYPEVIESTAKTGKAHVIKSHHNVGGLPDDIALQLVEPLRELFKDEVHQIGLELVLPHDLIETVSNRIINEISGVLHHQ